MAHLDLYGLLNPTSHEEEERFLSLLRKSQEQRASSRILFSSFYPPSPTPSSFLTFPSTSSLPSPSPTSLPSSPSPSPSPPPLFSSSSALSPSALSAISTPALEDEHDEHVKMDSETSMHSLSDENESEEEEEEEEEVHDGDQFPPKQCNAPKIDRVAHKVRKLIRFLQVLKGTPRKVINSQILLALSPIPEQKIKKKTVKQTAAAITFHVLKSLGHPLPLIEVVQALKTMQNSRSLNQKPSRRRRGEIIGITKLAKSLDPQKTSLEHIPKSMQILTSNLCQELGLDAKTEELARQYSTLADHPSLASRHDGSIAASCVFHAARSLQLDLTLARLALVSKVSACTIRKANSALEKVLKEHSLLQGSLEDWERNLPSL